MNPDTPRKFFGKYRGSVVNNIDPLEKGRLLVQVPDVLGLGVSSWALPCLPMASIQAGIYIVPLVKANVWVEFEQGNPDYPIWVGGFWDSAVEVPITALSGSKLTPNIVLQTGGQNSITIMGTPDGGITLSSGPVISPTSSQIIIKPNSIQITNGLASISLSGGTVSVNKGALEVT